MDISITMKKFDFLSFLTQWKEQHEIEAITNDLYFIELYNLVKNESCDTIFTIEPYGHSICGLGVNIKNNNGWELPYSLMTSTKITENNKIQVVKPRFSLFGKYLISIYENLYKKLGYSSTT